MWDRPSRKAFRRLVAVAMLVLAPTVAGGLGLASVASAASTATSITLTLTPSTIVADGVSTSTATATVMNNTTPPGQPVPGDMVGISVNGGAPVAAHDNGNGTYTATLTSGTKTGRATITAIDQSTTPPLSSAPQTLTLRAGPANGVQVQLSPPSIAANGTSTSTARAAVVDKNGNLVTDDNSIAFSSSDPGVQFGPVTNNGDGTYSATLTSSTTPGTATITATDTVTHASASAALTLAKSASTTSLSATPSNPSTNQQVTLVAIVTANGSGAAPSGTITFENRGTPIDGCANLPLTLEPGQQLSQRTCQTSFRASTSPQQLSAVFSSNSSNIADSSGTQMLPVATGATTTSLDVSNPTVSTGSKATYTVEITPDTTGPVLPSGAVTFLDGGQPVSGCNSQAVKKGNGSSTASCTVTYTRPGKHNITARYQGDGNFRSSSSSPSQSVTVHALAVQVQGTIRAIMQWTFLYTRSYTMIRSFLVNQVPVGASVAVSCRGKGCPYSRRVSSVHKAKLCRSTSKHKCPRSNPHTIDLLKAFHNRHLRVGTRLSVMVTRPNWIGKYYLFTVRAARPPSVHIDCLAPGSTRPGKGC